jgi:REP element-mobilizing transposase RayT
MDHSFTALHFHIIFSTKHRLPLLTPDIKPRLFDYLGGMIRTMDGAPLLINGPADHLHILATLPAKLALANVLRELKADASGWIKTAFSLPDFAWQTGYAAFTVSKSGLPTVRDYIANQEEHHRRLSFQEEYLEFLKRHEIDYDPRFVFD